MRDLVKRLRMLAEDNQSEIVNEHLHQAADAIESYEAKLTQAMSDYEDASSKLRTTVEALEWYAKLSIARHEEGPSWAPRYLENAGQRAREAMAKIKGRDYK